jgi:DNA-directed RNA polymerase I subunit RPA1
LEGLCVGYDQTVRDCDGSVIQFYYGEDGMDVCKAQFLDPSQIHILAENSEIVLNKQGLKQLKAMESTEEVVEAKRQVCHFKPRRIALKLESHCLAREMEK